MSVGTRGSFVEPRGEDQSAAVAAPAPKRPSPWLHAFQVFSRCDRLNHVCVASHLTLLAGNDHVVS